MDSLAPEERSAWIYLTTAVVGYPVYLLLLLGPADGRPLTQLPFAAPMLWAIGGSVIASMVLHAVFRVYTDKQGNRRDERDRQIGRWADHTGQAFVIVGALAGLGLAMLRVDPFWIANAIFLGFFLSGVLGSIAKIVAYRTGFSSTW